MRDTVRYRGYDIQFEMREAGWRASIRPAGISSSLANERIDAQQGENKEALFSRAKAWIDGFIVKHS